MKRIILSIFLLAVVVMSQTMRDKREGKIYKTVKIGNQTWMAENLDYETEDALCLEDNPDFCGMYGHLYTWEDAMTACPAGWHLPSKEEWETLINFLGGKNVAGSKMKDSDDWLDNSRDRSTNTSGFSALPGGCYNKVLETFGAGGANFWSSGSTKKIGMNIDSLKKAMPSLPPAYWESVEQSNQRLIASERKKQEKEAPVFRLDSASTSVEMHYQSKNSAYSVRCVKN